MPCLLLARVAESNSTSGSKRHFITGSPLGGVKIPQQQKRSKRLIKYTYYNHIRQNLLGPHSEKKNRTL